MSKRTSRSVEFSNREVAERRDEAVRRALSTPPKPLKDMKKGKKKQQDDHPTASVEKRG